MDFEATRIENDEALLHRASEIATAQDIKVLIPFAKAYLGMFYVIDAELAAKEKVGLLANEQLCDAILKGFVAAVEGFEFPTLTDIATKQAENAEYAEGYVLHAGLDLIFQQDKTKLENLSDDVIEKATGFYYTNQCSHPHDWFNYFMLEKKAVVVKAHKDFWVTSLQNNVNFLPGRDLILGKTPDEDILRACILPLLQNWKKCKVKILYQLMLLGFQYAEKENFLEVCEQQLAEENLAEKIKLYWVAAAYLLAPVKHYALLNNFVGRVKIKVMPLLDFFSGLVLIEDKLNVEINDEIICQVLKIIAPIFPPQHHEYGVLHGLDINSRNVMRLFYRLVISKADNIQSSIKSLRKTRVMKIYAPVMDDILELHMRKNNDEGFVMPGFDEYIKNLVEQDRLQGRSNRFD